MISDLTLSNLKSYASACAQLCDRLLELGEDGYSQMVVPSRGAAPLQDAASSHFHMVWKPQHDRGHDRLMALRDYTLGPMVNPMFLPFTADIPKSVTGVASRDVRRFWTGVLAAIVRRDFASPYYRFYAFLRERVCTVGFPHRCEEDGMQERFVFLDTVVSGQAVTEIMDAFDEFGLTKAHFVLLVDANGARMKPVFRRRIETMRDAGKATLIYLDRLFTEDQGPAVSGIWSVTMPELMEIARAEIPAFREAGAIGAGLYYTEVRAREDRSNLATTYAISSLSMAIAQSWTDWARPEQLEGELARLRDHLGANRLMINETTVETARPVIVAGATRPVTLKASASHAIRLHHGRDDAASLVREFAAGLR